MIQTKLFPWYMATWRKLLVTQATLGLVWSEEFLTVWQNLMFPPERN